VCSSLEGRAFGLALSNDPSRAKFARIESIASTSSRTNRARSCYRLKTKIDNNASGDDESESNKQQRRASGVKSLLRVRLLIVVPNRIVQGARSAPPPPSASAPSAKTKMPFVARRKKKKNRRGCGAPTTTTIVSFSCSSICWRRRRRAVVVVVVAMLLFLALLISSQEKRRVVWSCDAAEMMEDDASAVVVEIKTAREFDDAIASSASIWLVLADDRSDDDDEPPPSGASSSSSSWRERATALVGLGKLVRGIFSVAYVDLGTDEGSELSESRLRLSSSLGGGLGRKGPVAVVLADDKSKPFATETDDFGLQRLVDLLMDAASTAIRERSKKLDAKYKQQQQQQQQQRAGSRSGNGGSSKTGSSGGSSSRSSSSGGPSKVVTLTSSNFEGEVYENPAVVVVAFTAPWCGHCQRLQPEWESAARALDGEGAVLAWLDATSEQALAQQFQVKGYPTIKVFPGGAPKTAGDAFDYQGERTASSIVKEVLAEVDRSGAPKEIPELTSADVLRAECAGQNHICVLAALPHILDSQASGRNKYRDLLATVSKTFRGSAFSFLWFEGTSQPELEKALELTFGFPALVALSVDRKAYAVLHGSFTEKSMASFLHGITTGRQKTVPLDAIPNVATVEPWDGLDGEVVEEEFDLSEIMGEEF